MGTRWLSRFEQLANLRGHSLESFIESIGVSRRWVIEESESSNGPTLALLEKIADTFEITVENLIDGPIDEEWVKCPTLAPAFRAEAGSRLRTSLAVLRWIERHYGGAPATSLVRALRIPQASLRDPDQPVRLRMLGTLLQAARMRGLPESSIFEMGVGAAEIPENAWVRERLAKYTSPRQLYEYFFSECVEPFESNYAYRIERMNSESITLRIRPREERIAENGFAVTADPSIAIYRWGVAAGLLRTIGRAPATVTPLHVVTETTRDEVVRLDWDPSVQAAVLLSSRSRPRKDFAATI